MKRISMSLLVAGLIGSVGCTGLSPWSADDGIPEPITLDDSLEPVDGLPAASDSPGLDTDIPSDPTAGRDAPATQPEQPEQPIFPDDVTDANWTSQMGRFEKELERASQDPEAGFAASRR